MKYHPGVYLCLALVCAIAVPAQEPPPVVTVMQESPRRTPEELDKLLGPIALYPDALVALILPAAAAPVDIVLAARFLKDGGDPASTGSRAWDESVKSLSHYPDVVKWMDENIEWTKQLGDAFLNQPDEVMKAIQRLREQARSSGALASTPQQIVGYESGIVTIVPAQPDVIYVPRYEPDYIFVNRPINYAQPMITFGLGFAVGPWLTHDCDWPARRIWVVDRHWSWRDRRDWRYPVFPGHPTYVATPYRQPWRPAPDIVRPPPSAGWRGQGIQRPVPMAGAPVTTFTSNTTTVANPPRRERGPDPRRPGNSVAPAPGPATVEPSPSVPVTQWNSPVSNTPERRGRPINMAASAPTSAPPAPAMNAPQQTFANTPVPERRRPSNTAPTTAVAAPVTNYPTAAPMAGPSAPPTAASATARPQISMAPSAAPAPQTPPRAASAPSPTPARPPANPNPPPPSRDDKDNNRKKVEQ